MSTVAEITDAVRALPVEDLRALRALIEELEAARFDEALEEGAAAGAFDALLAKAEAEHRAGKIVPLHDILRDG
jgi:hypothetical protein